MLFCLDYIFEIFIIYKNIFSPILDHLLGGLNFPLKKKVSQQKVDSFYKEKYFHHIYYKKVFVN